MATATNAMKAVAAGAYDFYQKPLDVTVLDLIVQRAFRMAELEESVRRAAVARGSSPLEGWWRPAT